MVLVVLRSFEKLLLAKFKTSPIETKSVRSAFWANRISVMMVAMNEIIFLVEDAVEGGYAARAFGESIFTEADDLDGLRANIRDDRRLPFRT